MRRILSSKAKALWITALCVIGMEAALACFLPKTIDPRSVYPFFSFYAPPALEASVVQWQLDILLSRQIPDIDVLALGDSSCLMSIDSRTLERASGQRVWNLGTLGWLYTEGHARILQIFLETHAKPRRILYNISFYPLTTPLKEVKNMGYLDTFQSWLDLRRASSGFQLPSYRLRRILLWKLPKWFIPRPFFNRRRGPYPSDSDVHRLLLENQGSLIEPRQMGAPSKNTTRITFAPDCVPGLRQLFELSDTYQVPLYVMLNPLPQSYQSPLSDRDLAQIGRELETAARGHPLVKVRAPFVRYLPDAYFGSIFHLNEEGAHFYSKDLGRWLKELPPAPVDQK